ncbi:MAG: HAMP domain-containing protein [Thiotrichales bacterium]|nr:HAMP domain-containing protein [Thiotrichales bacterium]MBT3753277.1 HAMP domain-containing protein [Thiotrichales bacterium]MBT4260894.1 HAMP domain-containing protein [Thiotrichales bacterium]MBT4574476.1 HAMP domain-containing protein [Thiotrichales bacterium]MBT4972616.1 HAMP domain-containing protein [Thiotrichales bacterium]
MFRLFKLPKSIYSRTLLLVGIVMVVLQILTLTILFKQVILPSIDIQVNNFADALVATTKRPSLMQSVDDFIGIEEENETAGFIKGDIELSSRAVEWKIPFWYFLENELSRRFSQPVRVLQLESGSMEHKHKHKHYWVDLPEHYGNSTIRIGFSANRQGCLNPITLITVLLLVLLSTSIAVYLLARWLVKPILELKSAVGELGMGMYPEQIPEYGPQELRSLIENFNWMVINIRKLTENRSTLLAGISHDLKTPLARMRLSIEILATEPDPELINGMVEDIEVMDRMIRESLAYAQGEKQSATEKVELNSLITTVVERKKRDGRNISWKNKSTLATVKSIEVVRNIAVVRNIDRVALERILSNYLDNSERYADGKGVEVELHSSSNSVEIKVLDRGPGVPTEDIDNLFSPFFRVDSSRSKKSGGSGLGLAVVHNLAAVNGWSVDIENREGGGAVASVVIY